MTIPVAQRVALFAFIAFIVLCALGGGSARPDTLSLLYVRPAAVLVGATLLLLPVRRDWSRIRIPLMLLGVFAATMAIQLLPLHPWLWGALPGHGRFADGIRSAGVEAAWRGSSLTPDLTVNAILSLLPAAVVLIGMATLSRDARRWVAPVLLATIAAGAVLGLAQFASDDRGLYLYRVVHRGYPVGFFANKNHHAAVLAAALPMLRAWTLQPSSSPPAERLRFWFAVGLGGLVLLIILATGSRAGLALGLIGLAGVWAVSPVRLTLKAASRRRAIVGVGAGFVALLGLTTAAVLSGRAASVNRLLAMGDPEADLRARTLPIVLRMVRDFLPFGSGHGSFDPLFRVYEPDLFVKPTYFNRAHNDLLELALTGGVPGLLVFGAFCWWLVVASRRAFGVSPRTRGAALARASAFAIVILLLASLVDYPLRTPLASVIFTIACAWLALASSREEADEAAGDRSRVAFRPRHR